MKIAIYYNLQYGGAKRAVQEHVRGLTLLKHQVDVYTQDTQNDSFSPGNYADNTYVYPFLLVKISFPILSRLAQDLQIFFILKKLHKKIARDIDKRKYDIVLVHSDFNTQSPYLLRFLKTKNVYYSMEPLRIAYEYSLRISEKLPTLNKLYEMINRYIRKRIDRKNARSARHSLAISYFNKAYMIQAYDIYPKVSYLGVNPSIFHQIPIKKKNQILFIAPKTDLFGFNLIEDAIKLIPKKIRPEIRCVLGINKNERISDNEIVKVYNESIVTVSLSKLDTFGLVPLESMACGTPVIATDIAGYREIILNGKTGFLIDFDKKELAEKIMFFLKNPQESLIMGKRGKKWIMQQWTWDMQIKKLEILLSNFANKKQ